MLTNKTREMFHEKSEISRHELLRKEEMKKRVFNLLNKLSVPCHLSGRGFLETAILFSLEDKKLSMTKELYPEIAKIHHSTAIKVERCIRHAIEHAFENCYMEHYVDVFGNTIDKKSGKLCNSAFIMGIVKYLKIER